MNISKIKEGQLPPSSVRDSSTGEAEQTSDCMHLDNYYNFV